MQGILYIFMFIFYVHGYVHPIDTYGNHFIDTITNKPFFIKGVDYQPGGSSDISEENYERDPLSDPEICARDISLFQELGINTIRVYSLNSNLDHDICMSMLATAGIYLVLDVNSPLLNHHINRYEPWTTYTKDYLENIFKLVEQFSYYNNTLGFFAGNEILNDELSAKHSPSYIKAVIRDLKMYIAYNSPRNIPVGYSAADDLKYRVSFSKYLECTQESDYDTVDFYGVNSYQWCGKQTFYTSGYNLLVSDYLDYTKPIFLSEYGCNEIKPRIFDEVNSIYSKDMVDVFSGGLVYEFTNEPNSYGLVEIQNNGDIKLLSDFFALKKQYNSQPQIEYNFDKHLKPKEKSKNIGGFYQNYEYEICNLSYQNIHINSELPKSPALSFIHDGVTVERGSLINLSDEQLVSNFQILSHNGELYSKQTQIERIIDFTSESLVKRPKNLRNCKYINFNSFKIILTLLLAAHSFTVPSLLSEMIILLCFSLIMG